jgi:hypothetical protein
LRFQQGESTTSNATLSSLHDKTVEEFDKVRTVIVAFASAGTEAQPNAAQDCLNALNTLQESQVCFVPFCFMLYKPH